MFDDEQCVAVFRKALQDLEQLGNVVKMQPRRGFVQDIQGAAGIAFG